MFRRFRGCLEDIHSRKAAVIGNLRDHYLMVAMRIAAIHQPDEINLRAPTYFTFSFKSTETVALFNVLRSTYPTLEGSASQI